MEKIYGAFDIVLGNCIPFLVLVVANGFTIFHIRKYNKRHLSSINMNTKRSELRLTFMGIFLSITFALVIPSALINYFIVMGIVSVQDLSIIEFMVYWYYWWFDLFTLSSPYVLLFMSKCVRMQILALFNFRRTSTPTLVVPMNDRTRTVH